MSFLMTPYHSLPRLAPLVPHPREHQLTYQALDANLLRQAGEIDKDSPRSAPLEIQFDEYEPYEMCRKTCA